MTGQVIPGATFRLRYLNGASGTGGTVIGTKTTDASGLAVWTDLQAGAYIVEEISPAPGYNIIQASETVYIQPNGQQDVITVSFFNAPDGSYLLRKIDSVTREPLSDCEFLITDSTGAFIGDSNGRFVTNSAGIIEVDGITPGTTLIVKETRTRPGYVLDDTAQTITIHLDYSWKRQAGGSKRHNKRDYRGKSVFTEKGNDKGLSMWYNGDEETPK